MYMYRDRTDEGRRRSNPEEIPETEPGLIWLTSSPYPRARRQGRAALEKLQECRDELGARSLTISPHAWVCSRKPPRHDQAMF